jgi:hypothetical protein
MMLASHLAGKIATVIVSIALLLTVAEQPGVKSKSGPFGHSHPGLA